MTILHGVSIEEYHKRELGVVHSTALKELIDRSPAHYKAWVEGLRGTNETPALEFGRLVHLAILEPDRFADTYAVAPDFGDLRKTDRTTTEEARDNRAAKQEWESSHRSCEHVSHEWMARISGMAKSVANHPIASVILRGGVAETTVRWVDSETGLKCKCRPDYWVKSRNIVADLKTCDDASPAGFARSVAKYGYHRQDALYRDGMAESGEQISHFIFIAVEKEPPYACAVHVLDQDAVGTGYRAVRSAINTLAQCMKTGVWPAYKTGITEITLPPWVE